ncbi:MAG: RagB/SusD family nutrient uptake outer membrane protein [Bacteroidales bacterium]|nr:RagB/SusD family nutrient uptake outer membrane protein [Bacteroidales bacterium]
MKLRYIASFAAGVALMSLSSCSDFLDKVPDTRVELETVEQLRELLNNGYTQYNYSTPCELSTDNVIDNNAPDPNGVRFNLASYSATDEQAFRFEDVDMGMGSDTPSGIWEGCYHAIACANAVLERGLEMNEEGKLSSADMKKLQAVLGEAYLIRAYHHFLLAQVFCMPYRGEELSKSYQGIPYILKPETSVKPHYERGTLAETYELIEKDLQLGLKLVSDDYYEVPKYHFNKAAANAFAARFYVFTRRYKEALQYADAAFNGSDPRTMVSDIWANRGSMYYISDIGRYYTSMKRKNVFMNISTHSTSSRRTHGYRFTTNRDARRSTIQGPGPSWENIRWSNSKTKETFSMHPCFNGLCGTAGQAEYGTYFGGISSEQFEYADKIAGIGYAHVVRMEFWVEETLLCRAEAKLFLGDIDGCLEDLTIWDDARRELGAGESYNFKEMNRALIEKFYATDKGDEKYPQGFGIVKPIRMDEVCPAPGYELTAEKEPYMQCIQHFRRIETIHNGMRFFDIKRLGLEVTHNFGRFNTAYKLGFLDPRYAMQIPSEVISAGMDANARPITEKDESTVEASGTYVLIK